MTIQQYNELARKTESMDWDKVKERYSHEVNLRMDHAIKGIVTEAGELEDAMKKYFFYGKPMNLSNILEELGDLMWYATLLADVCKFNWNEILEKNIAKLEFRYKGEKFSETQALNRDLDAERKILEK